MKRTKINKANKESLTHAMKLELIRNTISRTNLGNRLGYQYGDDRKIYDALGYPSESRLLEYSYYFGKYDRQDIANAVISRPVDTTWSGVIGLLEEGSKTEDSKLHKAWLELNEEFKVQQRLGKSDKLAGIGKFAILLFGFNDVKEKKDFEKPVGEGKKKLLYLRQYSEGEVTIEKWEEDASHPRFGQPNVYRILSESNEEDSNSGSQSVTIDLLVHHSRVIHISGGSLTSDVFATPRLKPIVNRLEDLEKILGGDAETFWRGARPGYHVSQQEDSQLSEKEIDGLADELDNYEHDLRRFLTTKGVDINALEQQVAQPLEHIDVQIQAISAQTGIPKRILVGSERGELSSSQDKEQWLTLIQTRRNKFAEPFILRLFIDKCMKHEILPPQDKYIVIWEDIFAPSEKDKAEVSKIRSDALKAYAENPVIMNFLPPTSAYKLLLGLNDDQIEEVQLAVGEAEREEDRNPVTPEEEVQLAEENQRSNGQS